MFAEDGVDIAKKAIDVVKCGELFAKACLVLGEELVGVKELHHTVVDDALKEADEDAGDADKTIGRRIGPITLFEDSKRIRFLPFSRNDRVCPREVEDRSDGDEQDIRAFGNERGSNAVGTRSGGHAKILGSSFHFVESDGTIKGGRKRSWEFVVDDGGNVSSTIAVSRLSRRRLVAAPVGNGRIGHDLRVERGKVVEGLRKTGGDIIIFMRSNGS